VLINLLKMPVLTLMDQSSYKNIVGIFIDL